MEFLTALIKFIVNFWTDTLAGYVIDFLLSAL